MGPDGRRWQFESGSLALDFGYTGDYGHGRPDWERLHTPPDLDTWLHSRFGPLAQPSDLTAFRSALDLRAAITTLATCAADGTTFDPASVDALNVTAAKTPIRPHLPGGTQPALRPVLSAALSAIAADAIAILSAEGNRVRRCSADDCALIFFDHSRPNARRWCSMARCGNRAKIRAHRVSKER